MKHICKRNANFVLFSFTFVQPKSAYTYVQYVQNIFFFQICDI